MRRPKTAEELLDREEAFALQRIACATERFGDDLCEAGRLRAHIREHPLVAVGLGGLLGFLCGPPAMRLLGRVPGLLTRKSSGPFEEIGGAHPLRTGLLAVLRLHGFRA
jgi:hypothetical protein